MHFSVANFDTLTGLIRILDRLLVVVVVRARLLKAPAFGGAGRRSAVVSSSLSASGRTSGVVAVLDFVVVRPARDARRCGGKKASRLWNGGFQVFVVEETDSTADRDRVVVVYDVVVHLVTRQEVVVD